MPSSGSVRPFLCASSFTRAAGRALALVAALIALTARGARAQEITEAQLKAGYLYNFLLLAEWPEARAAAGASRGYVICVVGGDSVAAAFAPVLNRPVEGYPLRVERYPAQTGPEALRGCHIVAPRPGSRGRSRGDRRGPARQPGPDGRRDPGFHRRGRDGRLRGARRKAALRDQHRGRGRRGPPLPREDPAARRTRRGALSVRGFPWFGRRSLRVKMALVSVAVSLAAMPLLSIAIVVAMRYTFRRHLAEEVSTTAQLIAGQRGRGGALRRRQGRRRAARTRCAPTNPSSPAGSTGGTGGRSRASTGTTGWHGFPGRRPPRRSCGCRGTRSRPPRRSSSRGRASVASIFGPTSGRCAGSRRRSPVTSRRRCSRPAPSRGSSPPGCRGSSRVPSTTSRARPRRSPRARTTRCVPGNTGRTNSAR